VSLRGSLTLRLLDGLNEPRVFFDEEGCIPP
jgi:hypothetical protein